MTLLINTGGTFAVFDGDCQLHCAGGGYNVVELLTICVSIYNKVLFTAYASIQFYRQQWIVLVVYISYRWFRTPDPGEVSHMYMYHAVECKDDVSCN